MNLPANGCPRSRGDLDFVNTVRAGCIAGGRLRADFGSSGARDGFLKETRHERPNGQSAGIDYAEHRKGPSGQRIGQGSRFFLRPENGFSIGAALKGTHSNAPFGVLGRADGV
jgi:hypothetical protein